jgi:Swt1-like HEPN
VPLHRIPFEELRSACRQKLETCELWLRRLIHEQLSRHFGASYFSQAFHNCKHIFSERIRAQAASRRAEHPDRYGSDIDTLMIEDLITVLCEKTLYNAFFASALKEAFPNGYAEARTFLQRLRRIRNALSHANPISVHDAERVLCYCDDVIGSMKAYYQAINMGNEYNAPLLVRFADSLGHSDLISTPSKNLDYTSEGTLRPGDALRLEVEVDSTFDPESFTVEWYSSSGDTGTGLCFTLEILARHVDERATFQVLLKSAKEWHRLGTCDARLALYYKILPPLTL